MKESAAMLEIRKIRDENSQRYLKMTPEEIKKEWDESTKWFIEEMAKRGKEVAIAPLPIRAEDDRLKEGTAIKCIVKLIWDNGVWHSEVLTDSAQDVFLTLESSSCDALIERVKLALPEILKLNFGYVGEVHISYEIQRKDCIKARKHIKDLFADYDGGFFESEEIDWGEPQGNEIW